MCTFYNLLSFFFFFLSAKKTFDKNQPNNKIKLNVNETATSFCSQDSSDALRSPTICLIGMQ